MCKKVLLIAAIIICIAVGSQVKAQNIRGQEMLTKDFWEINDSLVASGIVIGLGYANGIFSNNASTTYTDDKQDVFEIYCNA
jgi:hypothetical protein